MVKCYRSDRNARPHAGVDCLRLEIGAVSATPGPLNIDILVHGVHVSTKVNNGHDPRRTQYAVSRWVRRGLTNRSIKDEAQDRLNCYNFSHVCCHHTYI